MEGWDKMKNKSTAQYKFKIFMTEYRAAIKSYLEVIHELNNQFVLSDNDLKRIETLDRWLTEYYLTFCYLFQRDDLTKAAFVKMFS